MEPTKRLWCEKARARSQFPLTGVIYTVTKDNGTGLERLLCEDLDLRWLDFVTIQMQSYVTPEMGMAYQEVLERRFGKTHSMYWKGMMRNPGEFSEVHLNEVLRQFRRVRLQLLKQGIPLLLFPQTWDEKNLCRYLCARWRDMKDYKGHCIAPWVVTDVTARGEVAPCHIFYDLSFGNVYSQGIKEIWNGEGFRAFRAYMRAHLLPICPACCQFYGYP